MIEDSPFLNSRGKILSGVLNNGRLTSPILIMLHGFASNKNENLFLDAEEYFAKKGYNVFRFDVEGAGDSEGDFLDSSLENQANDLKSAIDYVSRLYSDNSIEVIGFSLGATAAILANDERVSKYIFWSPALYPHKDMRPRYCSEEIRTQLKENGFIEKAGLNVGNKLIDDLGTVYLEDKIQEISKPVLLVHGSADPRIDYNSTVEASELFKQKDLFIIDGANHSFKENNTHREILFEKTYSWLSEKTN